MADARVSATLATRAARVFPVGLAHQTKRGYQCGGEADAEASERLSPCNGLSQTFGEFIKFVVHGARYGLELHFKVQVLRQFSGASGASHP